MALHTKKEFAELCGIPTNNLSVQIGRGKVVVDNDLIDDTNQKNKAFFNKRTAGKVRVEVEGAPEIEAEEQKVKKKEKGSSEASTLEAQKLQLEIDRLQQQVRIMRLEAEKKEGTLIPMDLAQIVILHFGKSTVTAFKNFGENWILDLQKRHSLPVAAVAEMRGELTQVCNASNKEAIAIAMKEIDNISNEYSAKRGVGQRKTIVNVPIKNS